MIDTDTRPPDEGELVDESVWTAQKEAAAEVAALGLLAAVIDSDQDAARAAIAPLAGQEERAWRSAWIAIDHMAIVWSTLIPREFDTAPGVIVPLVRGILMDSVPADQQSRAWSSYRTARAALRNGTGSTRPDRTTDWEADLWMEAAWAAAYGMATNQRSDLGKLLGYLDRDDRTLTAATLSDRDRTKAARRAQQLLGHIDLTDLAGGVRLADPRVGPPMVDKIVAAMHDSATIPGAQQQAYNVAVLAGLFST